MPEKITRDDGTEEEVFTATEVAERETQAAAAVKAELDTTKTELSKVNEDLKKLNDKDHNFSALRSQKEELEKKIAEMGQGVTDKIDEVRKAPLNDHGNEILANMSAGDDELKKKIKFQYDRFSDKSDSKESVTKKMNDAYLLAVGTSPSVDVLGRAAPAGGRGSHAPIVNNGPISSDLAELGKKMGLTDEDMNPKK
jgi:hypothetical protein